MTQPLKADGPDIFTLARTVWGEARGEPVEGKIAVAWVVRNRFESRKWFAGKTLAETCTKPWQFSCWNEKDPNRAKLDTVTMNDQAYQECMYAAIAAVRGLIPDPTSGATHYKVVGTSASWAEGITSHATIGRHEFFRDVP